MSHLESITAIILLWAMLMMPSVFAVKYNDCNIYGNCQPVSAAAQPTNYSNINVNFSANSDKLDGYHYNELPYWTTNTDQVGLTGYKEGSFVINTTGADSIFGTTLNVIGYNKLGKISLQTDDDANIDSITNINFDGTARVLRILASGDIILQNSVKDIQGTIWADKWTNELMTLKIQSGYDTSGRQALIGLRDTIGRQLILTDWESRDTNFNHTDLGYPAFYVQSNGDSNSYIRLYHNGTNGIIDTGVGGILFPQNITAPNICYSNGTGCLDSSSTFNQTYSDTTKAWNGNYSAYSQFWYNMSDGNAGNSSWNQSLANQLYAEIKWGYNMTTDLSNYYNKSEVDNNLSKYILTSQTYLQNYSGATCSAGNYTYGYYQNGTPICRDDLSGSGGDGGWQPNNITENNNYNTTGNVTASYFVGNASRLTNIPEIDPVWTANSTLVPYLARNNTFTQKNYFTGVVNFSNNITSNTGNFVWNNNLGRLEIARNAYTYSGIDALIGYGADSAAITGLAVGKYGYNPALSVNGLHVNAVMDGTPTSVNNYLTGARIVATHKGLIKTSNIYGVYGGVTAQTDASTANIYGLKFDAQNRGTNVTDYVFGTSISSGMYSGTTGNVTTNYNHYVKTSTGAGNVVNDYGFYKENADGTGNITNFYGVYIANQTRVTGTKWDFYGFGNSYMGGNLTTTGINYLSQVSPVDDALSQIHDRSYYLDKDGKINHTAFGVCSSSVKLQDTSRPVIEKQYDIDGNRIEDRVTYPYLIDTPAYSAECQLQLQQQAMNQLKTKNEDLTTENQRIKDCAKEIDYKSYRDCVLK